MPETLGLFDPLYAHEFLAFVARMFGLDEATTRRRVTELLAALELTDTSKTLSEYSTGMRKRVAFAAAVIHSPEVLFLDEPFESIDPAGVSLMKQWLRRLDRAGPHRLHHQPRARNRGARVRPSRHRHAPRQTGLAGRHHACLAATARSSTTARQFDALEPLFLHLTGERYADLNWL